MPLQAWLMLGVLAVMFALLIWGRLPAWLVFVGTLTAAMTLKLASVTALRVCHRLACSLLMVCCRESRTSSSSQVHELVIRTVTLLAESG
jgi:hypothetical protein